jgi:ribosomal-protein-alanine N-acetyltransferase
MNFRPSTKSDLVTLMTWVSDAASCLTWAGPKVRFPLKFEQLYQAIEFETTRSYSLFDETALLAWGQIRMFDNSRGHLSRIIVNPSRRGTGVGRTFCGQLIKEARKLNCRTISLHVVKENDIAIHLYHKLGFFIPSPQPDNIRQGIYYMELR